MTLTGAARVTWMYTVPFYHKPADLSYSSALAVPVKNMCFFNIERFFGTTRRSWISMTAVVGQPSLIGPNSSQ